MRLLKQRIAQVYYTHGLFCASHPYSILIIVCVVILITCYPLINLPLPGNAPLEFNTPISGYSVPSRVYSAPTENSSVDEQKRPRWYVGPPMAYIQQLVIKSAVSPWQQQLIPTDAFRAPMSKVFDVLRQVEDFQYHSRDGVQTIQDICIHVSEPVITGHVKNLLPQYSCFILSPANLWSKDHKRFDDDPEIIKTVFGKYGQTIETPPTLKDLLFGLPWQDTGVTRYFISNRQRVITYAVTIVLKKYDIMFIDALRHRLEAAFPDTVKNVNNSEVNDLVHVHYKNFNYIVEYTPLLVTYFVLLLYIYFSVRKIEMVKSQFGLAISAVVTVVSSLIMSLSLCFAFGLNPTLNGSEIFPYLVMIIGLENVLVITKSVVSTPVHLDVKIRVAQGLSREGYYITKNLCTELFIIFIGFFTFVPAIQEFSLFALVGLWTDFFLQMFFFATILSVDIRRMELADLHRQNVQSSVQQDDSSEQDTEPIQPLIKCPFVLHSIPRSPPPTSPPPKALSPSLSPDLMPSPGPSGDNWQPTPKIYRSKSAPRLDVAFGHSQCSPPSPKTRDDFFQKMPRRLKFFYFWANTRMFQRLIMVCTVIWITLIVYKTGLVEQLANLEDTSISPHSSPHPHHWGDHAMAERSLERGEEDSHQVAGGGWGRSRGVEELLEVGPVEHTRLETWRGLSHKHWPRVMALYNISLMGRYISILPSIHLSIIVDTDTAVNMRHSAESQGYVAPPQPFPTGTGDGSHPHTPTENQQNVWSHPGGTAQVPYYMYDPQHLKAFYPKSWREFFITVCLCVLSVIVISYFMYILYKCMCSRNYSRWRHSWARHYARRQRAKGAYYKQIKESVPLLLKGHNQEVECVAVDGQFVVSCCYGGQLRMWDSNTGECISVMQRHSITPPRHRRPCLGRNIEDSDADLYAEYHGKMTPESTSSSEGSLIERTRSMERRIERNRQTMERYSEFTPDLASTINTDFTSIELHPDRAGSQGFDFQQWFEGAYEEHRSMLRDSSTQLRERRVQSANDANLLSPPDDEYCNRNWSQGDSPFALGEPEVDAASPIWCLTVKDGLIMAGCGNGRIEMWEGESGRLKYQYNTSTAGVTAICFVGRRVIAARVDGSLDFLELETFHNPSLLPPPSSAQSSRAHKGHSRQYSAGNVRQMRLWEDTIRCNCIASIRAHQRPINCLQCEGDRLVSASQDHTLKVFHLEDCICLYTFYGHEGSITALCLDKCPPYAAASGSADGSVRLWDLVTGTCTHKFHWHEDSVIQLATSLQFVVSLGLDDLVCVWERTRSRLLHKLSFELLGGSIVLMAHNLGVLGAQGKLELWDLSRGEMVRQVVLQDGDQAFVTHMQTLGNNMLVCTAGADLRVISFPTTLEKAE